MRQDLVGRWWKLQTYTGYDPHRHFDETIWSAQKEEVTWEGSRSLLYVYGGRSHWGSPLAHCWWATNRVNKYCRLWVVILRCDTSIACRNTQGIHLMPTTWQYVWYSMLYLRYRWMISKHANRCINRACLQLWYWRSRFSCLSRSRRNSGSRYFIVTFPQIQPNHGSIEQRRLFDCDQELLLHVSWQLQCHASQLSWDETGEPQNIHQQRHCHTHWRQYGSSHRWDRGCPHSSHCCERWSTCSNELW